MSASGKEKSNMISVDDPLWAELLPVRVLLTAEPFGFGPSAALAQVFSFLRSSVKRLCYAGIGHTLDIHSSLPYDAVYQLNSSQPYEEFGEISREYDAVFASCDFSAAEAAKVAGVPVAVYDPLAWYWKTLPPVSSQVELYICQDFYGVRERLQCGSFKRVVIVPPLVPEMFTSANRSPDFALFNLGGLRNPFLTEAECVDYAQLMLTILTPPVTMRYSQIEIVTSASIAEHVKQQFPYTKTVLPHETMQLLSRCCFAVMTPGLGNIFEAACASVPVFWLPPSNDSQGQQLRLLQARSLAPCAADWHELLTDEIDRIDYFGPQEEVMKTVSAVIRRASHDARLRERLEGKLRKSLEFYAKNSVPLNGLIQEFGRGGDRAAALAFCEHVVTPLLHRARAGINNSGTS